MTPIRLSNGQSLFILFAMIITKDTSRSGRSGIAQTGALSLLKNSWAEGLSCVSRLVPFIPAGLSVSKQLNAGPRSEFPKIHVGLRKTLMGAAGASIFYDLTCSSFGRRTAQLMGARAAAVVWLTDYVIDDFGLANERRVQILSTLQDSIKTGRVYRFRETQQLENASRQLSALWRSAERAPQGDMFRSTFVELAEIAKRQISEPPSLDLAVQLGGYSSRLFASIPYCWKPGLSSRFLEAAHNLGAYIQIFDDICDSGRDKALGIPTFITCAESPADAVQAAVRRAQDLVQQAWDILRPRERWAVELLLGSTALALRQMRTFEGTLPLPR